MQLKLQILVGLSCISVLVACVALVLENYEEISEARFEQRLFQKQVGDYSRVMETNFVVFFATMISTSREILLFLAERLLKHRVSPFLVGLVNITIKMTCLTLFDFRVIHIYNTLATTRYTIVVADIASLLLAEAIRT